MNLDIICSREAEFGFKPESVAAAVAQAMVEWNARLMMLGKAPRLREKPTEEILRTIQEGRAAIAYSLSTHDLLGFACLEEYPGDEHTVYQLGSVVTMHPESEVRRQAAEAVVQACVQMFKDRSKPGDILYDKSRTQGFVSLRRQVGPATWSFQQLMKRVPGVCKECKVPETRGQTIDRCSLRDRGCTASFIVHPVSESVDSVLMDDGSPSHLQFGNNSFGGTDRIGTYLTLYTRESGMLRVQSRMDAMTEALVDSGLVVQSAVPAAEAFKRGGRAETVLGDGQRSIPDVFRMICGLLAETHRSRLGPRAGEFFGDKEPTHATVTFQCVTASAGTVSVRFFEKAS